MRKHKIVVSYDGTDFHGWQIQPTDVTITSTLERVFKRTFGESITVVGASRTDAGVHALGQVAHFKTAITIDPELIKKAWNASLPSSIVIRSIEEVASDFHACFKVSQKTYYYHLFLKRPLPFIARFGWHYRFIHHVDLQKFKEGLQFFVGEHDFTAFCKLEDDKSPIRSIDSISTEYIHAWGALRVVIKGKSFLRYQIRRIIGYTLDVARRPELPVHYLQEILKSKNPQQTLLQADGKGLCLRKIVYKGDHE
jgi:tRNA pseudouridine38-40 synthase